MLLLLLPWPGAPELLVVLLLRFSQGQPHSWRVALCCELSCQLCVLHQHDEAGMWALQHDQYLQLCTAAESAVMVAMRVLVCPLCWICHQLAAPRVLAALPDCCTGHLHGYNQG